MANTRFQLKRSSVSGVAPTTSDIATGELGVNLADKKLFTSNGSAVLELGSNLTNLAVSSNLTIGATGDLVLTNGAGIFANGSLGSSGQVLASNGSGVYWSTGGGGGISSIDTGNGLTGGPITTTGTISVLANNGITANSSGLFVTPGTGTVVNATGVHVNASYIGTLAANSATFLGNSSGTLANVASWITGNSATAYTNATSYADTAAGTAYANAVANAAALYQTTAGLSANVATLTANAAGFLGNSSGTLANVASWITGNSATAYSNATSYADARAATAYANAVANAAALYQTTAGLSANVATLTANNSTNLNGQPASFYTNASNLSTGTLPDARLSSAVVNTSGNFTVAGNINFTAANVNFANGLHVGANVDLTTTALLIGNATVNAAISAGSILVNGINVEAAITGNAATAYANAVANAAALYQTTAGLSANVATLTANAAGFLGNSSGTLANIASWVTGNSSTAFTNATTFASNASNLTTGTLPNARLGANVTNTSADFTITGVRTHQANIILGNTTVNTQLSNATVLISNATTTTTLGLTDLRIGNTATNVVIANTTSSFGGNVSVTGSLTAANLTAALFTGNVTGTASNATNLNSQPGSFYTNATNISTGTLDNARLSAAVVNTSGNFTLGGNLTFQGTNNQFSTGFTVGSNVTANTTQLTVGNSSIFTSINSTSINTSSISTTAGVNIGGNLTVTGNLTVNGTYVTVSGNAVVYSDNMLYLNQGISANITNITSNGTAVVFTANNNYQVGWDVAVTNVNPTSYNGTYLNITAANSTTFTVANTNTDAYVSGGVARGKSEANPDLGIAAGYNDGSYKHAGFFRDASDGIWKVFDSYLPEPDTSVYIDTSNSSFNIAPFQANIIYVGNTTVFGTISTTNYSGTSNNATNFGGLSLATVQSQITGNAATAYANAVANAAALYQTTAGLSANVATLTANAAGFLGNSSGTIANVASWITGNSATAFTNATTFASNASNLTTGTLPDARLSAAVVNTSGNFTVAGNINFTAANVNFVNVNVGANVDVNTTSFFVGNTTVNTNITAGQVSISGVTVNSTIYQGTANNANNLNGQAPSFYTNATNITAGTLDNARLPGAINVTSVNAATLSVGADFIANSTLTRTSSTLGVIGTSTEGGQIVLGYGNSLATGITGQANNTFNIDVIGGNTGFTPQLRIFTQNGDGTTTAILTAANTGRVHIGSVAEQTDSTFKVTGTANITANAAVGGALTAANITATVFTGALTGTASNATNLNSQPGSFYTNATNLATGTVPTARLGSGTANSTTFLRGDQTWATPAGGGGASLAGGELFNINVSNATGYAVTTSMAAAFTAPATAGLEYVVHSIQVTNISAANALISGEFSGTTYANTTFATSVPVPRESAVELLKMPKVLQPNDILRLQANTASALHAYITIETVSSTAYFGSGLDVTTDATFADLYTAVGNSVVTSVLLANDDGTNDVKARVVWTDASNVIQGYLCFDMIIPARGTVELLEKVKFLPNGHKIRVYANAGNRLEAIIAGKVL